MQTLVLTKAMANEFGLKANTGWDKTKLFINKWLMERQELLILYHEILNEYSKSDPKNFSPQLFEGKKLKEFCEILTDYIAFGHFKIFEFMAEVLGPATEQKESKDQQLLIKILRTTLVSLDFSDKYCNTTNLIDFKQDFSDLGEALANRFEWEDKLLQDYRLALEPAAEPKRTLRP